MALPAYGQDAIARRYGQQTNQFSMPMGNGPSPQPNFYQISPTQPGSGQYGGGGGQQGGGNQEPDRSRLYNPNFSGPMVNPYQEPYPTPYPGIQVSPTGAVTGAQPAQPITSQTEQGGGGGGGKGGKGGKGKDGKGKDEKDPLDPMDPRDDPRMKKIKGGAFVQGGRDWKGYDKGEKKFLGRDATLDEALRQLIASQGDYASQYNKNTGNISDIFRRQANDIARERGTGMMDLENNQAASGLLRSSGALTDAGNLRADFDRQQFDAEMQRTQGLTGALAERQNFMRQLEIARTQAREEALRRHAVKTLGAIGLIGQ